MHVDAIPFTSRFDRGQWEATRLGPVWIERRGGQGFVPDEPVAKGLEQFLVAVSRIAPWRQTYGTLYAVLLGPEAVTAGGLHYDLGELDPERGATRYVATWASDDHPLSNVFLRPEFTRPDLQGFLVGQPRRDLFVQPQNRQVVVMHEGRDLHGRAPAPARPGQWGVFISAALYAEHEPANLHCPRLAALRERGPRAEQAHGHRDVARSVY